MRCTALKNSAASARVRPLTASLISEADAVEMAQPAAFEPELADASSVISTSNA